MRRTTATVALGLALTALCLALGGTGCRYTDEQDPVVPSGWRCKLVVGSQMSQTQVFYCQAPTGECYLMPGRQGGALLPIDCYDDHPLVRQEEQR